MLDDFASVSGYNELKYAPIVPFGHSAMATYPWNFAAWNPDRTLAIISLHGDAPRTNLTGYGRDNMEWGKRTIDGIPGLMIEGEYEWWEDRVNPALAFRMMYPKSCVSFLCDTGRGHFDIADRTAGYIALFLKKALEYRMPATYDLNKPVELKKLNPQNGWLAERWHPNQKKRAKAAPYKEYKGDSHDAFWYFDKEMAEMTKDDACIACAKFVVFTTRNHRYTLQLNSVHIVENIFSLKSDINANFFTEICKLVYYF